MPAWRQWFRRWSGMNPNLVQERRAEAAAPVVWRYVELLEVRLPIGQDHDVGEADGYRALERDPEPAFLLGRSELVPRRRLIEDGSRRVPVQ